MMSKKKQVTEIPLGNEEELLPKKPKRSVKPITEKEWEMNWGWYHSRECAEACLKHYSDEKGIPRSNPFNPGLPQVVRIMSEKWKSKDEKKESVKFGLAGLVKKICNRIFK